MSLWVRTVDWTTLPRIGSAAWRITLTLCFASAAYADDWKPIPPDDLKMTDLPEAPGAPAVILYRQVDRTDKLYGSKEFEYVRIKVLTEAGRAFANVDIPIIAGTQQISSVRGRTVHPDGSIAAFDGKLYEQTIIKTKGRKYLAKTFTLPDVQVGSIIEYQYYKDFLDRRFYDELWVVSHRLFTRQAKFTMEPYTEHGIAVRWDTPAGLPEGTRGPEADARGVVRLEVKNVPAFEEEDYMPPEDELKLRVEFHYSYGNDESDPVRYWKQFGKKAYADAESFADKRGFLAQITAETVGTETAPQAKLERIYARVQQIRNLSYGTRISEQQKLQEGIKPNNNVEDVWKNGAAAKHEIDWLFLGMARAAGFEVAPMRISNRKQFFFNKERRNSHELGFSGVWVKLPDRAIVLDPGAKFAPFGLLPWEETGVSALKLDKDGGAWFETPLDTPESSRVLRKADLKLLEDGSIEGQLTVTYSGQEAFARRIDALVQDDEAREKTLEGQVKSYIPVASEVRLAAQPDWTSSAPTLIAEFHLKIPAWAAGSSKRLLLPCGLFSQQQKHVFEHSERRQAIYFEHPVEDTDEIRIAVPDGWQVTGVPKPETMDLQAAKYSFMVLRTGNVLLIRRNLAIAFVLMDQKFYPTLRGFFQKARTTDEEQIVLQPAATSSGS